MFLYETVSGRCPVAAFLESLPPKQHAKAVRSLELLEEFGQSLQGGAVAHIRGKLWELRIRFAGDSLRILYCIPSGNTFVLLHGFVKKTRKTPPGEIEIARNRMNDYISRMGSHEDIEGTH